LPLFNVFNVFTREGSYCFQRVLAIAILSVRHTGRSAQPKKFELMLTRRAKVYSSSGLVV